MTPKQKARVNDVGWQKIFDTPGYQEAIDDRGYFTITASKLKEISGRGPRLMCKHDYSRSRPQPLAERNLSVLPLSRDTYLVGAFDLYEPFPDLDAPLRVRPVPTDIESLDFHHLSSEALALSAASLAGVIEDFVASSPLHGTVAGRMSTKQIDLHIAALNRDFSITNAQMEIDGGYESADYLVLVEAKNHLPEDFNIRQLYFPYRRFQDAVTKPVIPIFVVYSNGVFHLHRYSFADPLDFRSIRLEDSARYILGNSTITSAELRAVLNRTTVEEEPPKIPFPQADSFARLISLCELLDDAPPNTIDKPFIAEHFGFAPRQADYYVNAGRYLGLIELDGTTVQLTPTGRYVLDAGTRDTRNLAFVELLAKRQVFRSAIEFILDHDRSPGKAESLELMEAAQLGLSGSTLPRRASTVAAWALWVYELLSVQLDLADARDH